MSSENENSVKNKSLVWLYSGLGVVLSFIILVILNLLISTSVPMKLDLTEDKVHTLSNGTKDLLGSLDTPVVMSFFVSKDKDNMPPELIPFTKRVESLLKEYERGQVIHQSRSKELIRLQILRLRTGQNLITFKRYRAD